MPPQVKKVRKKPLPVLPWAVAGILLIGITAGGVYWLRRPSASTGLSEIASALPQTTEVVVGLAIEPQAWKEVQKWGTPEARQLLQRSVQQSPFHALLRQTGMELQRDVQPWAKGKVSAALIDNPDTPAADPATLLIASTRNRQASREFLSRYRRALGIPFTQQTYQGVTYYQADTSPDRKEVTAEIGSQFVVIATHPHALLQLIDVMQSKKAPLSQTTSFQRAFGGTPAPPTLLQGYSQGGAALGLIQPNPSDGAPAIPTVPPEPEAIGFSVVPSATGVQVAVTTHLRTAVPNPIPNRRSPLVQLLPPSTFFLLTGAKLGQSWESIEQNTPPNTDAAGNVRQVRQGIENTTQLDLKKDILSWMGGEIVVAAIPATTGILAKTAGFGLVFLAESTDAPGADRFFQRLDELAAASDGAILPKGVTIETEKRNNQRFTRWKVGASTAATHGLLRDRVVFWAMGDLDATLGTSPPLTDNPSWQKLTRGTPGENGGYFYLDLSIARKLFAETIAPEEWKSQDWYKETLTLLQSLEGLAVTQTLVDNRTTRLDGFITLTPAP